MIYKTRNHLHSLPDIPRYVIVLPIISKPPKRRQFLLHQFKSAFPRRYREFNERYKSGMIPYKWFDVYRADPFVFHPHIVIAGVQRTSGLGYMRVEDCEFVLKAVAEWMRAEMPLVRDLCIGSPADIKMSNKVARVATKLFANDHHLRVNLFGRAKNAHRSFVC